MNRSYYQITEEQRWMLENYDQDMKNSFHKTLSDDIKKSSMYFVYKYPNVDVARVFMNDKCLGFCDLYQLDAWKYGDLNVIKFRQRFNE